MGDSVLFLFFSVFSEAYAMNLTYWVRLVIQVSFEKVRYKLCQLQLTVAFQITCFHDGLN